MADKITIVVDGTPVQTEAGANVLQTLLDNNVLLPHFCYHEALGAVGSCRLCAAMVAPAADKPARLEMTCMLRASDGMVVNANDAYATKFRKGLIEELMLNHPHDCPVCDEGGECMLQDMTVISEHQHRRTRFAKRTWNNQYLGPTIHHEMNRCITCYRCTRYYRDYSLGHDFGVYGSRNRVYFGRPEDGNLESEFAGNLVDVCPTGVFTNKPYREQYTRPWDLQTAHSICVNCSVGCNVLPGFRHETLRRIKPSPNEAVNRFFMCDRGRFGGEFTNHESRLRTGRVDGRVVSPTTALDAAKDRLNQLKPGEVAVIGSGRASLETNAAARKLAETLGRGLFAAFRDANEHLACRTAAVATAAREVAAPSLTDLETCDVVLIAGGDVTGEAPMLDLSLRQAVRAGAQVFVVSPRAGKLDEFAKSVRLAAADVREFMGEVARLVADGAAADASESDVVTPAHVAKALAGAKRPAVLVSTLHGDATLVSRAYAAARGLQRDGRLAFFAAWYPEANLSALALARETTDVQMVLHAIEQGRVKALVVVERNLELDVASRDQLQSVLAKLDLLVVIDSLDHATSQAAQVVVPCVSHYESFGTFANYELRAQRFEGLRINAPVTESSSEVLMSMLETFGAGDDLAEMNYHDIYEIEPAQSPLLDSLVPRSAGVLLKTTTPVLAATSLAADSRVWRVVQTHGSEALSVYSDCIVELAGEAVVEVHPETATQLALVDGELAESVAEEVGGVFRTRVSADVARGVLAVSDHRAIAATEVLLEGAAQ